MPLSGSDFEHAARFASTARRAELQRGMAQAVTENSARLARSTAVYTTTGFGTYIEPEAFMFGTQFVSPPAVLYGASVAPLTIGVESPLVDSVPVANGVVYQWEFDATGKLYVGAYVAVSVDTDDITFRAADSLRVEHHFTFLGVGLKLTTSLTNLE